MACTNQKYFMNPTQLSGRFQTHNKDAVKFPVSRIKPNYPKARLMNGKRSVMRMVASNDLVGPIDRLPKNATSPKTWEAMYSLLASKKIKFVMPEDIKKSRYRVLDIRPQVDYEAGHIPGSSNVEMYRQIKEWDIKSTLKRVQLAAFGIYPGVEENPEFIEQMKLVAKPGEKLLLVCEYGGSMEPTRNLKFGRQSRALTAAFMLYRNGYKNLAVVEEGMTGWFKRDLPVEGEGFLEVPFVGVSLPRGILNAFKGDKDS